jgi:hypothetical protein
MTRIDILDKPIERIHETCAMTGIVDQFDRVLPELETFLEGEVAKGETRETRLTYDGLCYLNHILNQPRALGASAVKPRVRRSRQAGGRPASGHRRWPW